MKSSKSCVDGDFYAVEFLLCIWLSALGRLTYRWQNDASVLPNYFIFFYYASHKFGMELVASLVYINDGFIWNCHGKSILNFNYPKVFIVFTMEVYNKRVNTIIILQ